MSAAMERVVVLGAGQAGAQVAASLRDDGFMGRIDLVGEEPFPPYQRPPLSKGLLSGKQTEDDVWLRPRHFYDENSISLHVGERATRVSPGERLVTLKSGAELTYDHLVYATGAKPRRLTIPGAHLPQVLYLRDLMDTRVLSDELGQRARNVVVIGGGFIGLEAASSASALGHRTTVLETASALMPRVASATVADFFLHVHGANGTEILLDQAAAEIVGTNLVEGVRTAQGDIVPADLVLIGIGVLPSIGIDGAPASGASGGIAVDQFLRTGEENVYAIGDCASFPCVHAGGASMRLESVQNATDQARHVSAMITGRVAIYGELPWFWSDQAGCKYQIAGLPNASDETIVLGDPLTRRFSALHFADNELSYVESINSAADHMFARRLLSMKNGLTAHSAAAPEFTLKNYYTEVR